MSGGSYDYLCFATAGDVVQGKREQLEHMLDVAVSLGYANDFAAELAALLGLVRRYEVRADEILTGLHELMLALEWWHSCDRSEDSFKQTLAEWRERS